MRRADLGGQLCNRPPSRRPDRTADRDRCDDVRRERRGATENLHPEFVPNRTPTTADPH